MRIRSFPSWSTIVRSRIMSSGARSTTVRSRITALLVALAALWGFAAYVTVQDSLDLLWAQTLDERVGRPTDRVITALADERRASLTHIGGDRRQPRTALDQARAATDSSASQLDQSTSSLRVSLAASDATQDRIADLLTGLARLPDIRAAVDAGGDRATAATAYTSMIDTAFLIYDQLARFSDPDVAARGGTVTGLTRCRELLAREDAMLSGVAANGRFAPGEAEQFVKTVGARRFACTDIVAHLVDDDRAQWEKSATGPALVQVDTLEDQLTGTARDGMAPAVDAATWRSAADAALGRQRELELALSSATLAASRPAAVWTLLRLVLVGGLGLVAVLVSIVVSITTVRGQNRRLGELRTAAQDLATDRLPGVVARLQQGERVDVAAAAPPLPVGDDEIGRVSKAFNEVQETAINVAVEQAELRQNVRGVFLSLARRSQALLHRQLALLDAMERRATDADELAELFRVDHLATRMRRNAENLIVLSGATAGRGWRKPVPIIDVVRAALAEVEDYTRVSIQSLGPAHVVGRAVGDIIHLLAELIENAVTFSPPQSVVKVSGSVVGNGFAIEIEDRGLGMSEQTRAAANEQLRDAPEFKLSSTARLGLYVVGKLAERHDIRVRLTDSPFGGTTAVVVLPAGLIADAADPDAAHYTDLYGGVQTAQSSTPAKRRTNRTGRPARSSPDDDGGQPRRGETTNGTAVALTPSGLPSRPRRQAHPGQVAQTPGQTARDPGEVYPSADDGGTSALERIRDQMSAYRLGTLRGRTEATATAAGAVEALESTGDCAVGDSTADSVIGDRIADAPEWTPDGAVPFGIGDGRTDQ